MSAMRTCNKQASLLAVCIASLAHIGCSEDQRGQVDSVDNTTCVVLSGSDDVTDFNSLRRKLENGFNQTGLRFCTDLIDFDGVYGIALKNALRIDNPQDLDCDAENIPVCHDGIAFELRGPIILDASKLPEQHCAITLNANNALLHRVTIISRIGETALCDQGTGNTLQVTFESP